MRLTLWIDGQYNALVQDIVGEAMRGVGSGWDIADEELMHKSTITWFSTASSVLLSTL
jgi:hypothetical protein